VGVFAPAGPVAIPRLRRGVERLEAEGFRVVEAANVRSRDGYLAGDDEARLAGLEELLDAGVEALLASRGGFGSARLLGRLPWERLARWGGWLVGFSDLTALHAGMAACTQLATLHGPMVATLTRHEGSTRRLFQWLRGEAPEMLFRLTSAQVVRDGVACGVAVGGNLSVLTSLIGSRFEPDWDGVVLFLEDVGEPLYRLDRMLTQLRLASRLGRIVALVGGRFVGCGRGERRFRERWRALLAEAAPPSAVVVEGLPFGHGTVNTPFPLGIQVEVDTRRRWVRLGG